MPAPLSCPKCRADLPAELALPGGTSCPSCRRPVEGLIFPAYDRPLPAGKPAEALVSMEDAGCFYHPQSRAHVPCDLCGRFLCALCDVELQGQHLCPSCIEAGKKKKRIRNLDDGRMLYGSLAFLLASVPILFWPLTIITAPIAVFFGFYGMGKPPSLVRTGRGRGIAAIILGLAEMAAWAWVIGKLFKLY